MFILIYRLDFAKSQKYINILYMKHFIGIFKRIVFVIFYSINID